MAAAIVAGQAGHQSLAQYNGRGQCYVEFGHDQVARIDVTFTAGRPPTRTFEGPSTDLTGGKSEFGATRIQRWARSRRPERRPVSPRDPHAAKP